MQGIKNGLQDTQKELTTFVAALNMPRDELETTKSQLQIEQTSLANMCQILRHDDEALRELRIPFDRTLYNKKHGYDVSSGTFTAPAAGTYMLWPQLQTHVSNATLAYVYIQQDSSYMGAGWIDINKDVYVGGSSAVVVNHVRKGGKAWVMINKHVTAEVILERRAKLRPSSLALF
ncbi:uncharacterized protein [Haliotis cracherodii]|uniref:uncharacterized protein n=1 Tax=Haliotis cracherodii TaxID=6455 RepID=UPI0039E890CB